MTGPVNSLLCPGTGDTRTRVFQHPSHSYVRPLLPDPLAVTLPVLSVMSPTGHLRQMPPTSQSPDPPGIPGFARDRTG